MNYKIFFKMILICILINCFLFPLNGNYSFIVLFSRIFLFLLLGIYFSFYTAKEKESHFGLSPFRFFISVVILIIFWVFYCGHNIDNEIILAYRNIRSIFYEATFHNIAAYSLPVIFIYDSFIESFALMAYMVLYFAYCFTTFALHSIPKKRNGFHYEIKKNNSY